MKCPSGGFSHGLYAFSRDTATLKLLLILVHVSPEAMTWVLHVWGRQRDWPIWRLEQLGGRLLIWINVPVETFAFSEMIWQLSPALTV